MKMNTRRFIQGAVGLVFISGFFATVPLFGSASGYQINCDTSGCHSSTGGSRPTVAIAGTSAYMLTGASDTSVYVDVTATHSSHTGAGFWLWASHGSLSLANGSSGISASGLNATHNVRRAMSNGTARFQVVYTAPASLSSTNSGTVTLNAWGNAVNSNSLNSGDYPWRAGEVTISICHDNDGDGYYVSGSGPNCPGTRDCDDNNGNINPGRTETCNGINDNCTGGTDEGCDDDGDGYCDTAMTRQSGATCTAGDCNDTPGSGTNINPGRTEICNGVDDNCAGGTDEGCDDDGDGYCDTAMTRASGATCTAGDCNDTPGSGANINPGRTEICNGINDNCAGGTDEGCDDDGDGYCDTAMTRASGATCTAGDCNDTTATVRPGATEICDGLDNNCDGTVDNNITNLTCGVGICQRQAAGCVNGVPQSCTPGSPGTESCSNTSTDDDCDGNAAELTNNVFAGDACTVLGAQGQCAIGTRACSGSNLVCNASFSPTTETCSNTGVDNDCDGNSAEIGNGIFAGDVCVPAGLQGICSTGKYACSGSTLQCQPDYSPGQVNETCANPNVDNDCDGDVSEIANGVHMGDVCETGHPGICSAGTASCSAGAFICIQGILPGSVAETCDGLDNNCDGTVDNKEPSLSCGIGACANIVPACAGGKENTCSPLPSSPEICDGLDNDCDGTTDEGCDDDKDQYCDADMVYAGSPSCPLGEGDCNDQAADDHPGALELCDGKDNDCDGTSDEDITVASCGVGACVRQGGSCDDGDADDCSAGPTAAEVCDGVDNDCDGLIDDNLKLATCGKGICKSTGTGCGPETCVPLPPAEEVCDGLDNDCDGDVDNPDDLPASTCGVGECARRGTSCLQDSCVPGSPLPEVCDGLDNDCNSVPDDGLALATCGIGACRATGGSCLPSSCQPGVPQTEICDGIDNDCDGRIDNGCDDDRDGYCDDNIEYLGSPLCVNGAGDCDDEFANTYPGAPELCDGADNDCNGLLDDEIQPGNILCGVGACVSEGTYCEDGVSPDCAPKEGSMEVCDGLDNDCNGIVDDGLEEITCGLGACAVVVPSCHNGMPKTCVALPPNSEACDGLDNDCDGEVDDEAPCAEGVCLSGACVVVDPDGDGTTGDQDYSDPTQWLDDLEGQGIAAPEPADAGDGDASEGDDDYAHEKGGCAWSSHVPLAGTNLVPGVLLLALGALARRRRGVPASGSTASTPGA